MFFVRDNYIKIKTPYNPELINQLKEVNLKEINIDGYVSSNIPVKEFIV